MKVLFFISFADYNPEIARWFSLIQEEIDKGNEPVIVHCGYELEACHVQKLGKNVELCVYCQSKLHHLLRELPIDPRSVIKIQVPKETYQIEIPQFKSVEEISHFEYKGCDIGLTALSNMVSQIRDTDFDVSLYGKALEQNIRTALASYLFFDTFLKEEKPDLVYLFNGRFSEMRPLLYLCKEREIDFYTIEQGSSYDSVWLSFNNIPHDFKNYQKALEKCWDNADKEQRTQIAEDWLEKKRNAKAYPTEAYDYVKGQQRNLLPSDFDINKKNIAIFNSSQDEVFSIMKREYDLYNQNRAIRTILDYFSDKKEYHFYLRIHPNLKNLDNQQTKEIAQLDYPNLTIIPASHKIDSYALAAASHKVVTFGSTIGAEATFMGKIAISYGFSFIENLDATYHTRNLDELIEYITNDELQPKPKENVLPFAYWNTKAGVKLTYFTDLALTRHEMEYSEHLYEKNGWRLKKIMHHLRQKSFPTTLIPFKKTVMENAIQKIHKAYYQQ